MRTEATPAPESQNKKMKARPASSPRKVAMKGHSSLEWIAWIL